MPLVRLGERVELRLLALLVPLDDPRRDKDVDKDRDVVCPERAMEIRDLVGRPLPSLSVRT